MRRVLIAGQDSFIGTALARRLADFPGDYAATTIDMRGDAWRAADFSGFDSLVHVAGIAHVSPKPEMAPLYAAVNRDLPLACARRAREMGVSQFVFLSSAIVFGEAAPAGRTREIGPEDVPRPVNAYGQSKLDAEKGLRALETDAFRVAVLRPMMVFGPGCRGNYGRLSAWARRGFLFPDFPNRHGTVYIEDLAELLRRVIDAGGSATLHPQTTVVATADFVREAAAAAGRRLFFPRAFNPLLRLLGRVGTVRRAFGGFCYRADLAARGYDEGALSFAECVRRTENVHG